MFLYFFYDLVEHKSQIVTFTKCPQKNHDVIPFVRKKSLCLLLCPRNQMEMNNLETDVRPMETLV